MDPNMGTREVLREVEWEVCNQDVKWGEQNHPLCSYPENRARWASRLAEARESYEHAALFGKVDWALVLLEEVYEAVSANTTEEAIAELIQVAAVAVNAIKSLRRNKPA